MAKQKCGTCRYFQEAGLAGSGWCHHPQRKTSSGVMIMVRRNELACRDEWSRSLWASHDESSESEPRFQRLPTTGPALPANSDELRAVIRANSEDASASSGGEDVLLSEGRIVSESHQPPLLREAGRPAPGAGFDPRAAIIKAREARRERNREKASAARLAAGAEAVSSARQSPGADPGQEAQAELDSFRPGNASPKSDPATRTGTPTGPALNTAHEATGQGASEVDAEAASQGAQGLRAGPGAPAVVHDASVEETWSLSAFLEQSADDAEAESPEPEPESRPELALDRINQLDDRQLPAWFRDDLPRVCRTCRDFRPSAEGDRGWCANAWAFTHRRMVDEDELAPCVSAIGDWWAPVDDVWLVAADVSSHGRATPLLDRLVARGADQRKRS